MIMEIWGIDLTFAGRDQYLIERTARVSLKIMLRRKKVGDAIVSGDPVDLSSGGAAILINRPGMASRIELEGVIDIAAEKARLAKSLEVSTKEARSLEGRLNNPSFVEKAKPEAVEKARADHAMHAAEAERLSAALARLG